MDRKGRADSGLLGAYAVIVTMLLGLVSLAALAVRNAQHRR